MRVLFFVEGFTDIRFVVGLSESVRADRRRARERLSGERPGRSRGRQRRADQVLPHSRRPRGYQVRSWSYLWRHARDST